MLKRLMPLFLVMFLCTLPLAALTRSTGQSTPKADAQVRLADGVRPDVRPLTSVDRQALQTAEQSSDPALGDLRGGGLIVVLLLLILIVLIVR